MRVRDLRDALSTLTDWHTVRINRHINPSNYETPHQPDLVCFRPTVHGLVIEAEDSDVEGMIKGLNEDIDELQAKLESAKERVAELEAELAKLKQPAGVVV